MARALDMDALPMLVLAEPLAAAPNVPFPNALYA